MSPFNQKEDYEEVHYGSRGRACHVGRRSRAGRPHDGVEFVEHLRCEHQRCADSPAGQRDGEQGAPRCRLRPHQHRRRLLRRSRCGDRPAAHPPHALPRRAEGHRQSHPQQRTEGRHLQRRGPQHLRKHVQRRRDWQGHGPLRARPAGCRLLLQGAWLRFHQGRFLRRVVVPQRRPPGAGRARALHGHCPGHTQHRPHRRAHECLPMGLSGHMD